MNDGLAHLERPLEDDARRRLGAPFSASLAKSPQDIFDVDDRIVHDDPDGDHKPGQDHRIESRASREQHEDTCGMG